MTDSIDDTDELASLRAAAVNDPEVPEVVRRFLGAGARLDALRLTARGVWTFNDVPVAHPRVCTLFSRSLRRTSAGTWVLSIPPYTYPVLVDGVGRFVHRVRGSEPDGELGSGAWVSLDLDTLETDGEDYLGVVIDGERTRLVGAAYQRLAGSVDSDDEGWFLNWNGRVHRIAQAPGPPASLDRGAAD